MAYDEVYNVAAVVVLTLLLMTTMMMVVNDVVVGVGSPQAGRADATRLQSNWRWPTTCSVLPE